MAYEILYSKRAEKALARLNDPQYTHIRQAIDNLAHWFKSCEADLNQL